MNVTQIVTVDKSLLSEKIGTLDRSSVEQIIQGLRLLIEPTNLAWLQLIRMGLC